MGTLFDHHDDAWQAYAETPWARIRYGVVEAVLEQQTQRLGGALRVLDVGGGDGRDAIPLAQAGHEVTLLDPAESWLAKAALRADAVGVDLDLRHGGLDDLPPGEWDLVLCHFVLRYRPAGSADLQALTDAVSRGGVLSLIDVNPAGKVLRQLVTDGPAAAHAELRADRIAVQTFATEVRKIEPSTVRAEAASLGLSELGLYGIRVANDLFTDDSAKHDPACFDDLLALELELCGREPFNQIGFAWQLLLEK